MKHRAPQATTSDRTDDLDCASSPYTSITFWKHSSQYGMHRFAAPPRRCRRAVYPNIQPSHPPHFGTNPLSSACTKSLVKALKPRKTLNAKLLSGPEFRGTSSCHQRSSRLSKRSAPGTTCRYRQHHSLLKRKEAVGSWNNGGLDSGPLSPRS